VSIKGWIASESWKRTAVLGWIGFLVAITRWAVTGDDPGAGIVSLVLGTLGIAGGWHAGKRATNAGKRATNWRPVEAAEAEKIRNGFGQ
jgi:hypothetical protein